MVAAPPDASTTSVIESVKTQPLVSSSQISLFTECERKWAFRYLDKIETEQHPAAALGVQIDDEQIQPYLRDNRPLDYTLKFNGECKSAEIVAAGVHLLPGPKTLGLEIQKHITFSTNALFGYRGYVDIWLPRGGLPGSANDGTPCVSDAKSTGNWRYKKSAAQLAVDVQANLYARWAFGAVPHAEEIDLGWVYFSTKKPYRAETTHLRVTRAQSEERFAPIEATAREMFGVRKSLPKAIDLRPNIHACGSYGGCPYQHLCNLSPTQAIDAAGATWLKQVETKTMTTESKPLVGLAALRARVEAEKAKAEFFAMSDPPAEVTMVGINPPESLLPPAPALGTAEAVANTTPDVSEPAPEQEKRRPGRPKKDTNAPAAPVQLPFPVTDTVTVTWGEEVFTPVPYNTFKVGPFTATTDVRAEETISDASDRLYKELSVVAARARDAKAIEFKSALSAYGLVSK